MLCSGSHGTNSTNWNSAVEVSKSAISTIESANVTTEVQSATWRELAAICRSSPRISRMKNTPTRGRNVTVDRIGQSVMPLPARDQIPGDDGSQPQQHREGVVIDVA